MDGKALEDHDSPVEPRRTEVLEVEDEDARHDRIRECTFDVICIYHSPHHAEELFERLDAARAPVQSAEQRPFDFGDRSTFPVAPPLERQSACLSQDLVSYLLTDGFLNIWNSIIPSGGVFARACGVERSTAGTRARGPGERRHRAPRCRGRRTRRDGS